MTGVLSIPPGQQNLTQVPGVTATSSSDFSVSFNAPFAIDQSNSSSWCTTNNDSVPMLTIDFPSGLTVSGIGVRKDVRFFVTRSNLD